MVRRGFFVGVAVFLALTAALKLWSALLETKVLAAPDPLLPLLSVRQMTFAAALLELAVARLLWRNRGPATATSAWLVLWLVGIFGTYRLGLWAVGSQGHCNCLGHLLDWVPGFNAWADRALLASLFVMALGSGCHLRGAAHNASGSGHSAVGGLGLLILSLGLFPTRSVVGASLPVVEFHGRWKYEMDGAENCRFLSLCAAGFLRSRRRVARTKTPLWFVWVLAAGFVLEPMAGAAQLRARGVLIDHQATTPTELLSLHATIFFAYSASNSVWRLVTIADNIRAAEGKVQYMYGATGSDGKDTYSVSFVCDHLDFSLAEEARFGEVAAERSGTGHVRPGARVDADYMGLIAAALGYSVGPEPPGFQALSVELSERLCGVPTTALPDPPGSPGALPDRVRFRNAGYCLNQGKREPFPAPFDQGYIEGEFVVLRRASVETLVIPAAFEYHRYIPRLPAKDNTDTRLAKRIVVSVTNSLAQAGRTGPIDPFAGMPVRDHRLREPTFVHLDHLDYNLRSSQWLKQNDPWLQYLWRAKLEHTRERFGQAGPPSRRPSRSLLSLILVIVALSPVPFVARRVWKQRKLKSHAQNHNS